ncbi:TetR/AcrR family transcriptional regulator [Parvibaculum sp.]|jgi:AcrR family transcriptional regulator|uniref:TetR/AcrR family transcriptional regulator n=1 Tax=Parvibaculum sp. TaxID=2024848 RepID=UPI001B24E1CD|nr:TetR/AcrR family transcriptional regulator [Parvibaculum sp.]MBO6633992.1 TetR/AcrR family transcriptional regulator [Parvibaculum sp.]MBO6680048.1 TetR/AcrR family transcriptional regulator [Parvibaculum sp.]MBO6683623.1 TetR/AcrR family transcriptional regulator [Parvibaculum sp.]MBO6904773.1 TetR/AcrR family transcriptional regulator [Parvibaculum sp.]
MTMEETGSRTREAAEAAVLDEKERDEAPSAKAAEAGSAPMTGASRRKLESRRKLMAAARKLFVERGYHETRPQDISKAAGVGHGTFYLHFEDKLDCFLAFTEEAADELHEFVEQHHAVAGSLEEGIHELLTAVFEYSDENPGVLGAALTDISVLSTGDTGRKMPVDRWAEVWAELLEKWKEEGEAASDLDARMAGYLIVGAIKQGGAYGYRRRLDRKRMIDGMTKLFVRALKK